MIPKEKITVKQLNLVTLKERIDKKFIDAGLNGSKWAEPDPTRHRIIVRMPRQKQAKKGNVDIFGW